MSERPDRGRDDPPFYVGYLEQAPPPLASHVRRVVVVLFALALLLGLLFAAMQNPFSAAIFEFGVEREYVGVIVEEPYPTLMVRRPGRVGDVPGYSRYLLTVFGKFGAKREVAGLDRVPVRLRGELIQRDGQAMIQVADDSIKKLEGDPAYKLRHLVAASRAIADEDLGEHSLRGEIVDSKCYLGVMKPGHTKPHRGCAARCISGGVPPVLMVRDDQGQASYFLLVDRQGRTVNRQVLPLVAEPVEITGQVIRQGDLLILRSDPSTYRRL